MSIVRASTSCNEPGTPAAEGHIPLSIPEIRGNEWKYVKECLDTGWVSSVGAFVDRFERELAARVGTRFSVATSTGTAALHIALLVSGVQQNDEVLVPTLTFIAPANAVRYVGAWPVFIDAEPRYWQMDPQKTLDFLERSCVWTRRELRNRTTGRRIKAILPVHILGHPADLDPILEKAFEYGLVVVEDATESLGAAYKGRTVGRLGQIGCFSFNGNKLITSGGGGMIVTDNQDWAKKARYLTTQAKDDPVEFIHGELGYNYRLTNIQAALGCAQLEQLDSYIAAKRRIAAVYAQGLNNVCGILPMQEAPHSHSIFWMYTILVDPDRYGLDSRALLGKFDRMGIQTRPLWQPLHLRTVHRAAQAVDCSVAERLGKTALSLPCSVGLSNAAQSRVIEALKH